MGKRTYDIALKTKATDLLKAGVKATEVASQLGLNPVTVRSWRKELIARGEVQALKGKNAPAKGGEDSRSVEQQLIDWEFTVELHKLENKALVEMLDEPDPGKRREIEIKYLRKRLSLYGDELVKPLGAKATNGAHAGEQA